jgi:hypothetical protein
MLLGMFSLAIHCVGEPHGWWHITARWSPWLMKVKVEFVAELHRMPMQCPLHVGRNPH